MITGIVAALPEETSTLTARKIGRGCCEFIAPDILLALSGAGPENAKTAAELLLTRGAGRLLSWGCAAALSEDLTPGDLTLVNTLVSEGNETLDIQSTWQVEARRILRELLTGAHCVRLAESATIVVSASDKRTLQQRTDASVVDMETVAIAKVARQRNVPFLAIRAIADPVDMDLPQAVAHALSDEGDVILPKLLTYLIRHPSELPGLIKLGIHFKAAQKTLRLAAQHLAALTHSSRT